LELEQPYRNVSPPGGGRGDLLAGTVTVVGAGAVHRRPLEQHHLVAPGAPNGAHTGGGGSRAAAAAGPASEWGPRLAPLPDGPAEGGVAAADGAVPRGGAAEAGAHGVHLQGASGGGGGGCPPARRMESRVQCRGFVLRLIGGL
jgi:hypothetical protein